MRSAKSLLLTAPKRLEWHEEPLRSPRADEVLLETLYTAVSVGTELPLYRGDARSSHAPHYPLMTGYESLARVLACGDTVTGLAPGDTVFGFYGHRSHVLLPSQRLVPVPEGVGAKVALLAILSCDVKKGIRKLSLNLEAPLLLTGAGAIGLLTLFILRALGVMSVDVIEPQAQRRALAKHLGARRTLSPEEAADLGAYPFAIECSSRNTAFALLQAKLEQHGHLCVLADGNLEPFVLTPHFHEKELKVIGSSDGEDYVGHAAWFYGLKDVEKLETLFGLEVHAAQLPETFADLAEGKSRPVKVFVRDW